MSGNKSLNTQNKKLPKVKPPILNQSLNSLKWFNNKEFQDEIKLISDAKFEKLDNILTSRSATPNTREAIKQGNLVSGPWAKSDQSQKVPVVNKAKAKSDQPQKVSIVNKAKSDQSQKVVTVNKNKEDEIKNIIEKYLKDSDHKQNLRLAQLEAKIDRLEDEIVTLKQVTTVLRSNLNQKQQQNDSLKARISTFEEKIEKEENLKKRDNLVFFGISQEEGESEESTRKKIKVFIKEKMGISPEITKTRRIGNSNLGKPAPLIVTIPKEDFRTTILKNGKKLKGTRVFVSPDYAQRTREKIRILNIKRREELKKDNKAYFRGDKLYVNDIIYSVNHDNDIFVVKRIIPSEHHSENQLST